MDAAQWPQAVGIGVVQRGSSSSSISISITSSGDQECSRITNGEKIKKVGRGAERELESLNCPRCKSSNTKFCYYNNYSLSQPRYFCKSCRRYWTAGGTLRNVPVGGTSRKKHLKTSSSSSSNSKYSSSNISKTNKSSIPDLRFSPPTENPNTHLTYLPYSYNQIHPPAPPYNNIDNTIDIPFTHLNPQNPNLDTGLISPGVSSAGFELGFSLENRFGNSQAAVQDFDDSNGFWSGGSW